MEIHYDLHDLSDVIRGGAATTRILKGKLLFLFQTTFTPERSRSNVWFFMFSDGIMLRTAAEDDFFKEIPVADIRCIRVLEYGPDRNLLEIRYKIANSANDFITVPKKLDASELEDQIRLSGISVVNSIKR